MNIILLNRLYIERLDWKKRVQDGITISERKIISIMLFLLFISLIPLTMAAENHSPHLVNPAGYKKKYILGVIPRASGTNVTLFLVLPFFGRFTINRAYFSGHLGLQFVYGIYNWFPNGLLAISPFLG